MWPPVSCHDTLDVRLVDSPLRPPSYLYATHASSVFATASIRTRLVPRYTVKRRLPAKIPIDRPGNVTARLAPSVVTVQDVVWNDEVARRISDGVRGPPRTRAADGSAPRPRCARCACISGPSGITSGASQNAYHRFFAITSGVSWTPAARSGSACCSDIRRTPLVTRYSAVRFCPRIVH